VQQIAESFVWPFRGDWRPTWAVGVLCVLLLPLLFIPLLGYAVAATRAADEDPSHAPPAWRWSGRLVADGFWTSLAVLLLAAPFLIAFNPLANFFFGAHVLPSSGQALSQAYARVIAALVLALPWGLLSLLLMPHATAAFAASGRPQDLFNFAAAIRGVSHDFATWNVAAAAIVTAWAVGVACAGLLCVGVVPGIFYAILVSAHAASTLARQGSHSSAG
jgi:hypothetical protein